MDRIGGKFMYDAFQTVFSRHLNLFESKIIFTVFTFRFNNKNQCLRLIFDYSQYISNY